MTTVLLTPVFLVVALMAFQAALWTHARTETRAVARDAARAVARQHQPAELAEQAALAVLVADVDLIDPSVEISLSGPADAPLVTVLIGGRAPGLVRGTARPIEIREVLPVEAFRP